MRFVLASGNKNKLREFRAILAPHEVAPMPAGLELPPEGVTSFRDNAVEKARALAAALAADAALRAQAAGEGEAAGEGTAAGRPQPSTPILCIADDSGIEVEALGWAPGVTSARYAGEGAGDDANYLKLLADLGSRDRRQRRARFVCALAAVPLPPAGPTAPGPTAPGPTAPGPTAPGLPVPSARAAGLALPKEQREYVVTGEWWGTITAEPHGDGGFGYDPVFLPVGSELTVAQLPQEVKDQASHRALAGRALIELLEREGLLG